MTDHIANLIERNRELSPIREELAQAAELIVSCYQAGGKVLICGNGGSAADSEHIAGELLKGFLKRRPLPETLAAKLPAGLILDGRLYCGADDMAGELGHIRLAPDGPVGYGTPGSMEGFCSGGGIAALGRSMAEQERAREGCSPLLEAAGGPEQITAKLIAELADAGDSLCREIYRQSGEQLGKGLSILVDLLNPEMIIIGSVFARSHHLLWEPCSQVMERECLPVSLRSCRVVPSRLGDALGDIAALAIAAASEEE